MKKTFFIAALALAGLIVFHSPKAASQAAASKPAQASSPSVSDQDVALLRQDIRSQKKQLIAANLVLTDAEATKFWPVYDQYSAELSKIYDTRYTLIKEYAQNWGSVTDAQADSLVTRSLQNDEAVAQLRLKYVPIFGKVIPGKKVATFFQLDRRLSTLIDLQIASQIPLMQQQPKQ